MKPIVIVFTLCVASISGSLGAFTDLLPDPTTEAIVIPSTEPPTTKPTTSTEVPTTAPTTPAPTTTPVPPQPTTTAAPITTTAKPPKPVPPTPGNWTFQDPVTKQTCIMVQMAITLSFDYKTTEGKLANLTMNVPPEFTKINGSCSNTTQMLKVDTKTVNFSMEFVKENGNFEVSKIQFTVDANALPNAASDVVLTYENKTFINPMGYSYYCTHPQKISFTESSATRVANITVSHVHLEAFHDKPGYNFSTARDCDASPTPDIVPIAVGIALFALVFIMLIAYIVARRRSQARGYMSM